MVRFLWGSAQLRRWPASRPTYRMDKLLGLGHLVELGVGELEEGERAAVGHRKEGMAELDLSLQFRTEVLLAPGRGQGNPEEVFEEPAVDLMVFHHKGV